MAVMVERSQGEGGAWNAFQDDTTLLSDSFKRLLTEVGDESVVTRALSTIFVEEDLPILLPVAFNPQSIRSQEHERGRTESREIILPDSKPEVTDSSEFQAVETQPPAIQSQFVNGQVIELQETSEQYFERAFTTIRLENCQRCQDGLPCYDAYWQQIARAEKDLTKSPAISLESNKPTETSEHFIERALATVQENICHLCQDGYPCHDAAWHQIPRAARGLKLIELPSSVRGRIYAHLRTNKSRRLESRPALRYASHGFPTNALLISKALSREMRRYTIIANTFNVVVGHDIAQGTILSSTSTDTSLTYPPKFLVTSLHLLLEVDLDHQFTSNNSGSGTSIHKEEKVYSSLQRFGLFASDDPSTGTFPPKEDNIYLSLQTFCQLIRPSQMPNLKELKLSICEIIPPARRIHVTCQVNESDVMYRYSHILQPLFGLKLPQRPTLEDIDAIYGGGWSAQGANPANWVEAKDYIVLWKRVLLGFGCVEGRGMALSSLLRNSMLPAHHGRLSARRVFIGMQPTHPFEAVRYLPPRKRSMTMPTATPRPTEIVPTKPRLEQKLFRPAKRNSLRRILSEGTSALTSQKRAPDVHGLTHPASSEALVTSSPAKAPPSSKVSPTKTRSRSSLGKYWVEGAKYTLETFANATGGVKDGKSKTWST